MKWNKIATCPLETPVLVVESGVVQHAVVQRYDDGVWFQAGDVYGDPWEDFYPTHWMPLPDPPSEGECDE